MNYEELVKALRERQGLLCYGEGACPENCELLMNHGCYTKLHMDAAAAIEELLPKRGKWITHPEVKNIYGGVYIECPFCGEKYVVQYIADEKFCRNCGADMRAKMEVQE